LYEVPKGVADMVPPVLSIVLPFVIVNDCPFILNRHFLRYKVVPIDFALCNVTPALLSMVTVFKIVPVEGQEVYPERLPQEPFIVN
jgi:hypothetical protein